MLTYALDRDAGLPLQGQLYQCIRADIEAAALGAGERLPSKRALAQHLGVSVVTVEAAYRQLVAEGYVESRPRSGYYAAELPQPAPAHAAHRPAAPSPAPASGRALPPHAPSAPSAGCASAPPAVDLAGATPAVGRFPYASWARTIRQVLADESERSLLAASGPRGSLALRQAIASHLHGFRGMDVAPDQIVVAAGAQTLYHLLVQLLGRHRRFAVETPGYPRLAATYRAEGVDVAPVALDASGPSVAALRASGASVLHCMPSHQFPTGLVTSAPRRFELLGWAREEPGRYLVEDDYDCEFRMAGRPVPSLQGVDADERVIYLNTFTKSLGSAFRIGYMVLPPHLSQAFDCDLAFHACTVGALEQAALARFIASGDYERHVNRTRTRARRVQDALVEALRAVSGDRLALEHVGAGLHFVLRVDGLGDASGGEGADLPWPGTRRTAPTAAQARFLEAVRARGVRLAPLSDYDVAAVLPAAGLAEAGVEASGSPSAASAPTRAIDVESQPHAPASCEEASLGRFLVAFGSLELEDVARVAEAVGEGLRVI
ncbi:MAG: PLP-dependent aminotransferase family protein [Eggerthellaceae bacterium]|nr:PLP-dependent aminotransferase family protein [Eggerthellaceae bacterium]